MTTTVESNAGEALPFFGTAGLEQYTPGDAIGNSIRGVQRMEELGYFAYGFTDQTQSWIFRSLWEPDLVPAARFIPDYEAFFDTLPLLAVCARATEHIRLSATIDCFRRPPGVLAQTLNTLDHVAQGRIAIILGSGENKQFEPYGLERPKARNAGLEEAVGHLKALMTSADPVTRDGKLWPLRDALIGLQPYRPDRPMRIMLAGGGPRLMRAVAKVGDGLTTYIPGAYAGRPDELAEDLDVLWAALEEEGRDRREIFVNPYIAIMMLCEDDDQAQRCRDNPYTRAMAMNLTPTGKHWQTWGSRHPLGDDWMLSQTHRTTLLSRDEALDACARVSEEDLEHTVFIGKPEDVASRMAPWLRAAGIPSVPMMFYPSYAMLVCPELADDAPDGRPRWHHLNERLTDALNAELARDPA